MDKKVNNKFRKLMNELGYIVPDQKEMIIQDISNLLRTGEIKIELLDVKTNKIYKADYNGNDLKENKIKLCIYR